MCNKLIIWSFACLLSISVYAQGDNSLSEGAGISIYPNPAVEHIVVKIDESFGSVDFELNSMIGNRIHISPQGIGDGRYKIPVKNLATGYYFLVVKNEKRRFKKAYKFLKH